MGKAAETLDDVAMAVGIRRAQQPEMRLATVAETDLIGTMPRRFVATHAARFAVVSREVPLRLRVFSIKAASPKVEARATS